MKTRMSKRVFALLVVFVMLLQMIPVNTYAETIEVDSAAVDVSEERPAANIVGEEEALRGEEEKHFRLSDGSYIAVSYGIPVHYQDTNGAWQDIDNSMTLVTTDDGNSAYQTANMMASTAFAADLTNGMLLSSEYEEYTVSMHLLDTAEAHQMVLTADDGAASVYSTNGDENTLEFNRDSVANVITNSATDALAIFDLEETNGWSSEEVLPENLCASVLYENVYPGVDLLYTAYSYNIKEQIVVREKQSSYTYHFLLDMDGLFAIMNEDGSVSLKDSTGIEIYEIPAPYMQDSAHTTSQDVEYVLTEVAAGTILTVTADAEWINSEEREFPVCIDPTFVVKVGRNSTDSTADIYATYVVQGTPASVQGNYQHLYFGYQSTNKEHRIYMHFNNLPEIPTGSTVIGASLNLYMFDYSSVGCNQMNAGVYEVTDCLPSDYSSYYRWLYYMKWNNKASYNTGNMIDYTTLKNGEYGYYSWDLTELAKKWYIEGTENRTIAMAISAGEKEYSTSYCAVPVFFAYSSSKSPLLIISYRNNVGIEPYYTYATMSAGTAGTGYVSDATGQLKVAKEILSYASAVNPFSLNFVYNSDYFAADTTTDYQPPAQLGLNMKLGSGWTLDAVQKVEKETISDVEYIRYHDGDGTIHYFAKDKNKDTTGTFYYDEDGLGLKIKSAGSTTYEMSDDKDNKWIFINGYLTQMVDSNGNQYNIAYSNKQISSISQKNKGGSEITVATIAYDGNYVKSIKDAAGNVFTFTRDGEKLTEILRNDSVIARYTYSNRQLIRLTDIESNYSLVYSYSRGKVSRYYEEAAGETGVYGEITYPDYSQTVYRDYGADRTKNTSDDVLTYYLFDYAGRTANVYTTDNYGNVIGASNAAYSGTGSTDRTNNRTLRSATIGIAGQQLIRNSSFESTSSNAWNLSNTSISTTTPRSGTNSLKGTLSNTTATVSASKASESLVAKNTYTLSGFVNTCDITEVSGDGIYLKVSDSNGNSWLSEAVRYTTSTNVDDGWVRISVTFTAESSTAHTIGVYGTGVIGTFYVDDLQLESGVAPSNRNMLENGNMQISGYAWSLGTDAGYSSGTGTKSSQAMKITGSPIDDTTNAYQDVVVNLPGTQTYVLSGWVKANAVPDNDSSDDDAAKDLMKQCGLRAIIYYSDNTTENHYVPFNADLDEWQFTSLTIVPKETAKTVSKIRVICAYEKNANIAYFDDISLVQEVAQTMKYDEDGNLVSTTTTGLKEDTDTYEDGNLIKTVTGGNGTYTYTYDTTYKHRLISVSNSIVKQTLDYDASGNVVKTTLQGVSGGDSMVTSATYTNNGNLVESVTDMTQQTEEYAYGTPLSIMTGQATSVTDANGVTITSEYNSIGRVTEKEIANTISLHYNYASGLLGGVTRTDADGKSQTLSYSHDVFGNFDEIGIGGITLAEYTYGAKNGSLQKQTYGNGDYITFEYDNLQRTTKATYSSGRVLTYTYTGDGQLHTITDNNSSSTTVDDIVYCYTYDTLGRVIDCQVREGIRVTLQVHWEYDDCNRVKSQGWQMGTSSYKETYTYNATDGSLISISIDDSGDKLSMSYDTLQRLTQVEANVYSRAYSYTDINDTQTTSQVNRIQYSGLNGSLSNLAYAYTYNSLGNIETIKKNSNTADTFTYDDLGQLTYAYLPGQDLSFTYTYDTAGNLKEVQVHGSAHSSDDYTNTYVYGNSAWLDLLTSLNNQNFAYEGQTYNAETGEVSGTIVSGNPISYYNGTRWYYDWAEGRNLISAGTSSELEDIDIAYTYDSNGLRTSKTVTTEIYEYAHVHSYSTTVVDPTCTESGYTLYECECGDSYQGDATPATGHSYGTTVVAPTCTETGYTVYECDCGDSYQGDETAALGHDYAESTSGEYIVYTCTRCDDTYAEHDHSYVSITVSATCTAAGYTQHTCSCGHSYKSNIVAALGHNYKNGLLISKSCTRCGYTPGDYTLPVEPTIPETELMSEDGGNSASYALSNTGSTERVLVSTITEQHDYIYASGKLLRETITTTVDGVSTTETLDFRYDENGYPYSLTHISGDTTTTYFYITNLQGDVTYLVDADGYHVASYNYDPYGKILSSDGDMAELNPLRYRSYYYDQETEFYYLQARYYDPAICRFINADTYSSTGQDFLGYNAFAYCGNNPVNRTDPDGEFWDTVFDIVSIGFSIADVVANPTDPWAWAGLAGDLVDLVPFVTGVGEATRAVSAMADAADVIDDIYDTAKFVENADDTIDFVDNVSDARKAADNLDIYNAEGFCFVSGTLVSTEDGYKAIEEIEAGDLVWAWDEETGEVALKEVVEKYVNETRELVHVFVCGEEIISTPAHPFYSPIKGWMDAVHLRAGDVLLLVNGEYVVVEKVQHEILEAPINVFNFQVKDYHNYYVTTSGVLVHNSCMQSPEMPPDGTFMDTTDALTAAEDYLGPGYIEASPGRFVSTDGSRQVRITDSDLAVHNNHAGAPHMNFELWKPIPNKPGRMRIAEKAHVFLIE